MTCELSAVIVVGDMVFHKYSEELTLKWLHRKVKLLADKLEEVGVQVEQGSRTALVVSTKNKKATKGIHVYADPIPSSIFPLQTSVLDFVHTAYIR